jgi:hypothetical protein
MAAVPVALHCSAVVVCRGLVLCTILVAPTSIASYKRQRNNKIYALEIKNGKK